MQLVKVLLMFNDYLFAFIISSHCVADILDDVFEDQIFELPASYDPSKGSSIPFRNIFLRMKGKTWFQCIWLN